MSATKTAARPCTCHPDDNPPMPCAERYALSECKAASAAAEACKDCGLLLAPWLRLYCAKCVQQHVEG